MAGVVLEGGLCAASGYVMSPYVRAPCPSDAGAASTTARDDGDHWYGLGLPPRVVV